MEIPAKLVRLVEEWDLASERAEKKRIWDEILEINAEQVYSIGIVSSVPQPIVVRRGLRNVPREGIYHWDPGAYFGLYRPDSFWYDTPELRNRS